MASKAKDVEKGKRLKKCRKLRGLSQEKLVDVLEPYLLIDRTDISKYENGSRPLSSARIEAIAQALNVRQEYLSAEDDFMTSVAFFENAMQRKRRTEIYYERRIRFWSLFQAHHFHVLNDGPETFIIFKTIPGKIRKYYLVPKSYVEDMYDRLEFTSERGLNLDFEFNWLIERKGSEISEEEVIKRIKDKLD